MVEDNLEGITAFLMLSGIAYVGKLQQKYGSQDENYLVDSIILNIPTADNCENLNLKDYFTNLYKAKIMVAKATEQETTSIEHFYPKQSIGRIDLSPEEDKEKQ